MIFKHLYKNDYTLNNLAKRIYLYERKNAVISYLNNEVYNITSPESYLLTCDDITYSTSSSYSGKYRFESSLEITLQESQNVANYAILERLMQDEWLIGFESVEGDKYLLNAEFETLITYSVSFNDSELTNPTTIKFTANTNVPNLTVLSDFKYNNILRDSLCEYQIGKVVSLQMAAADEVQLVVMNDSFSLNERRPNAIVDIEYIPETLSFVEEFDGTVHTQTLTFRIPYKNFQHDFHYNLLTFELNNYYAVLKTLNDKTILGGYALGMQPEYNITAKQDVGSSYIEITLVNKTTSLPLLVTDKFDVTTTDGKQYKKVYEECVGKLFSTTLIQQLNRFGETEGYWCLAGFEQEYADYNIIGTYHSVYTTQFGFKLYNSNIVCTLEPCKIDGLPTNIMFSNVGDSQSYTINSSCPITVMENDNCQIDLTDNTLTITNGVADGSYTIILIDASGYKHIITVSVSTTQTLTQNKTVTAQAQQINVKLSQPLSNIASVQNPSNLSIVQQNDGYTVSITANESTVASRQFTLTVTYNDGNTEIITITQDKLYEFIYNDGTQMCVGNDLYNYAKRLIGYTKDNITIDCGYVQTTLAEPDSNSCKESTDVSYSTVIESVCIDGVIFDLTAYYDNTDTELYRELVKTQNTCESSTATTYTRWIVNELSYECVDNTAYAYEFEQASTDNATWYYTGNKRLSSTVVEDGDCSISTPSDITYTLYRWVDVDDEFYCLDENATINTITETDIAYDENDPDTYMCIDGNLWSMKAQYIDALGNGNIEFIGYEKNELISENSDLCK